MIPKEKKKVDIILEQKISAWLAKITSKHNGDFRCLNYLHSVRTENKRKSHEKVCKSKDFCGIVTPSKDDNILKFNQYVKKDRIPYIICANLPPGNKTLWRRRNDVSLYVSVTPQLRLKWNTERHLDGTSPRCLSGTSLRHLTGTLLQRRNKRT